MNKIEFGWLDKKVIIRVVGKGSFLNSRNFKEAVQSLLSQKYESIIIDFKECTGMDSTFIGVLTGVNLRLIKKKANIIQIANITKTNRALLETLGVIRFFNILEEECVFDINFESVADTPEYPDEAIDQIKHILEAHKHLMEADEQNKERFKLVAETLEKELKQKTEQKEDN
ncbi:STAS domain-containing protein [bacterium]|nr:STAS domain-containing protein [bacterium]